MIFRVFLMNNWIIFVETLKADNFSITQYNFSQIRDSNFVFEIFKTDRISRFQIQLISLIKNRSSSIDSFKKIFLQRQQQYHSNLEIHQVIQMQKLKIFSKYSIPFRFFDVL